MLLKISEHQYKITKVLKDFKCTEKDLDTNVDACDLCALYMPQIGDGMVKGEAMKEVIDRINFCREHAEE